MALVAGTRLGHYEILSPLGTGGMGEVYRARDSRLNRDVAMKVLLPAVASDPDRLARFRREAQVLAALNHPHIAQLYGIEDGDGQHALLMELVEGPTLADRIERGRLPWHEALPIAVQIAEALGSAHDQRIVHRDLKPSNIKVRVDGTVKVLDFGLAKALEAADDEAAAGERAAVPTITAANTMPGVVLGTPAYMPPEQIKGHPVDKRADLWAFGCVLFEMLSGRRAFDGPSSPEVLARVIEREPDWDALPRDTPASIRRLLRRCLAKDPRRRLDSAAAVRLELDEMLSAPPTAIPETTRGWPSPAALALVGVVTAIAGVAGSWMLTRPAPPPGPHVTRFAISLPSSQALAYSINDSDLALSADGRQIVFTAGAQSQLHVRALDQLDAVSVTGVVNARAPFLSPDGRWIGFFDRFDEGVTTGPVAQRSALRKVSTSGGPPIVVAQVLGASRGAVWGQDEAIVFATSDLSTGIMRVAAGGGEPEVLTRPDAARGELDHYYPSLLPGGRGVLFTIVASAAEGLGTDTAVLDQQSGQQRTVLRSASQARYVSSGHLVYATAGTLWAVQFDVEALAVVGDPVPLVQQVLTLGAAAFAISRSGTLVFVPDSRDVLRTLVWVSRDGAMEPIPAPARRFVRVRLSPDGTRVAAQIRDDRHDLWIWDFARERPWRRLTFDSDGSYSPIWTRDGRDVIYGSPRDRTTDISNLFRRAADGTGAATRLTTTDRQQRASTMTIDGSRLILEQQTPQRDYDLMMISLADPTRIEPVLQTPFDERDAEISPDGRWMAYDSNESGQLQVYVRPFPNVSAAQYQVSVDGGRSPVWSPRADELFFVSGTSLMRAAVDTAGSAFKAGSPGRLFDAPSLALDGRFGSGGTLRTYDVAPDGQRFLAIRLAETTDENGAPPASFVVVENWLEELTAKFAGGPRQP